MSGCSVLYNLAKLGVTNAVLLEKDALTAGTTWHTAGMYIYDEYTNAVSPTFRTIANS